MLVIAIASEEYVPVGNISGDSKVVIQGGALPNGMGDINDDANGIDIDEVAAIWSPKRGVGVWPVLIVVMTDGESIKVVAFIIIRTVDISPISVDVVSMA